MSKGPLANPASGSEVLGGHPPSVGADKERDHVSDICGLSESTERRHRPHGLPAVSTVVIAQHVGISRSW